VLSAAVPFQLSFEVTVTLGLTLVLTSVMVGSGKQGSGRSMFENASPSRTHRAPHELGEADTRAGADARFRDGRGSKAADPI